MYINGNDAKLLLNGFQHGFSLQYTGPRVAVKRNIGQIAKRRYAGEDDWSIFKEVNFYP